MIFISHSSQDTWVAQQIAKGVAAAGAETFVDANDVELGNEDFEDRIREALGECSELIVLLTPEAISRPYVWLEIGAAWSEGKRVSAILYRISPEELRRAAGVPVLLLKQNLTMINDTDRFIDQLRLRIQRKHLSRSKLK
jgi:hypothetical protein